MKIKPGEVLLLSENLPGTAPGAYVLLGVQDCRARLCVMGEDMQGALCTTPARVSIDIRDLPAFRRLNYVIPGIED